MPLIFHQNRVPSHWPHGASSRMASPISFSDASPALKIGIINNMPDSALEDTEAQLFRLLALAADDAPVHIELYSLPHLSRGQRALQHLSSFYRDIDDLWNQRLDALIVTGTEPRQPNLKDEPYWSVLVDVLDWAEQNTTSAILSCLTAHAGVLYSDGIPRHRLGDKRFGVFTHAKAAQSPLLRGTADPVHICHSRWNEVRADDLASAGYTLLTQSPEAGVDLFVKQKGKSLFVHFQGHPEYLTQTLFKEYRRDIKRYLRGERDTYPSMPLGYFDPSATKILTDFQKTIGSDRGEHLIAQFPEGLTHALQNTWSESSAQIYRNWLELLRSAAADARLPAGAITCRNV
jgi:homoserine O-succinyltransferase/O-acetyltransferase